METPILEQKRSIFQIKTRDKYRKFLYAVKKNLTSEKPLSMRQLVSEHRVSDQNRVALYDSRIVLKRGNNLIWNGGSVTDELILEFHNATIRRGHLTKIKTLTTKLNAANYQLIVLKNIASAGKEKKKKKKKKKAK